MCPTGGENLILMCDLRRSETLRASEPVNVPQSASLMSTEPWLAGSDIVNLDVIKIIYRDNQPTSHQIKLSLILSKH